MWSRAVREDLGVAHGGRDGQVSRWMRGMRLRVLKDDFQVVRASGLNNWEDGAADVSEDWDMPGLR